MSLQPGMLAAAMMGGAGGLGGMLRIPCAVCVLLERDEPANGATLAAGTLVCLEHVPDLLAPMEGSAADRELIRRELAADVIERARRP